MLKHISIYLTLVVLGTSSVWAQQHEALLRQVELPGAGLDIVVATPKSPAAIMDVNTPDALIMPLIGGELALAFEDGSKMLEAIDFLQHPGCAFRASDDERVATPISVYVIPQRKASGVSTASHDVRLPEARMRKVKLPETDFDIVYTTTSTPITWTPREGPDSLAVYSTGYELTMATDGDIATMFKDVGLSQWPSCAFYVEHKGSSPLQAASVYIVPKTDMTDSSGM